MFPIFISTVESNMMIRKYIENNVLFKYFKILYVSYYMNRKNRSRKNIKNNNKIQKSHDTILFFFIYFLILYVLTKRNFN